MRRIVNNVDKKSIYRLALGIAGVAGGDTGDG